MTKYWAFISYTHADNSSEGQQWATWLHGRLEKYDVPAALRGTENDRGEEMPSRLFPCFRDEEELAAGSELDEGIQTALEESRCLVVLCSPQSIKSSYVLEEIQFFKKLGKNDQIFLAIVSGDPGKLEGEENACIPSLVRSRISENLNLVSTGTDKSVTPLAADFRLSSGGEGWTSSEFYLESLTESGLSDVEFLVDRYESKRDLAFFKLVAGVMGVPLGELQQRDKEYQLQLEKKRLAILRRWLMGISALFLTALALGIFAWFAKAEAERQTLRANQQQGEAEAMVGFMLGELHDEMKTLGQLEILKTVVDQSGEYLEGNPEVLSPENRLQLRFRRGQILKELGQTKNSIYEYSKALEISSESPSLENSEELEARIRAGMADVLTYAGQLDEARENCSKGLELLQNRGSNSSSSGSEIEARLDIYLADILLRTGTDHEQRVLSLYQEAADLLRALNVSGLLSDIPLYLDAHLKLGDTFYRAQDVESALMHYKVCLERAQSAGAARRADVRYKRWQAEAHVRVSRSSRALGKLSSAKEHLAVAKELMNKLVEHDPANASWQIRNAVASMDSARLEANFGDVQFALELLVPVEESLRRLSASDSDNQDLRHVHALVLGLLGEFHYSPRYSPVRDLAKSELLLREAVQIHRTLVEKQSNEGYFTFVDDYSRSVLHLSRCLGIQNRPEEAVTLLQSLEKQIRDLAGASENLELRDERAKIAEALGDLWARHGHAEKAHDAWTSTIENLRTLVAADQENLNNQIDLATNLTKLGVLAFRSADQQGRLTGLNALLESETITADALKQSPENMRLAYLRAKTLTEIVLAEGAFPDQAIDPDFRPEAVLLLKDLSSRKYRANDCRILLGKLLASDEN